MRNALALTGLIVLALTACGKKADNAPASTAPAAKAVNAAATNAPAPAAQAKSNLPPLSPDACAVLGTYVKVEMVGDFGLPLQMHSPPDKDRTAAAELIKSFPTLKAAEAQALAAGLNRLSEAGDQVDCDWKALGLAPPRPQTDESEAWLRFRPAVEGDVAVLQNYTGGVTELAGRCLYRKTGGAWTRETCVLTKLG
jgi:hypothetical protein